MKPYTAPECVFDRPPHLFDRVKQAGRTAVAMTCAVIAGENSQPEAARLMHKAEKELHGKGSDFAERWRSQLGDQLAEGVRLTTVGLPYAIEATLTKNDTPRPHETLNDVYETNMTVDITQASGRITKLAINTTKTQFATQHEAEADPVHTRTSIFFLKEDGSRNRDGAGWYTFDDAAELYWLGVRVFEEIDNAAAAGNVIITPLAA